MTHVLGTLRFHWIVFPKVFLETRNFRRNRDVHNIWVSRPLEGFLEHLYSFPTFDDTPRVGVGDPILWTKKIVDISSSPIICHDMDDTRNSASSLRVFEWYISSSWGDWPKEGVNISCMAPNTNYVLKEGAAISQDDIVTERANKRSWKEEEQWPMKTRDRER